MYDGELIIQQTKKWVTDVVIGCNFCPFASKVVRDKTLFYRIEPSETLSICLEAFLQECSRLDKDEKIETILIIYPTSFQSFQQYLHFVSLVEKLLRKHDYEGIYQVATFHPDYCFAGEPPNDPANYTNRSPYPMIHILREESIEKAIKNYSNAKDIPAKNVQFAREKGEVYMKMLRDACLR